jgi:uncharacterized protein YeeX (DUF496 family)
MKRDADNLERYITENRKRIDLLTPPPELRKRIVGSSPRRLYSKAARRLAMAAGLALVVAIPSLFYVSKNRVDQKSVAGYVPGTELYEAEIYYTGLMISVFDSAGILLKEIPALESEVMEDIRELETIGEELRSDLKENVNNREVVEALVRNYRIRIRLLEELLEYLAADESFKAKTIENGI